MFTDDQLIALTQPLDPRFRRVKNGQAYMDIADVTGNLNRIFHPGGWSKEVLDVSLVSERTRQVRNERTNQTQEQFVVLYRARVRLTIHGSRPSSQACVMEDEAMGQATNPYPETAHDQALKSAVSNGLKRCAKNLGDQFGLGLKANRHVTAELVGFGSAGHESARNRQNSRTANCQNSRTANCQNSRGDDAPGALAPVLPLRLVEARQEPTALVEVPPAPQPDPVFVVQVPPAPDEIATQVPEQPAAPSTSEQAGPTTTPQGVSVASLQQEFLDSTGLSPHAARELWTGAELPMGKGVTVTLEQADVIRAKARTLAPHL